MGPRSLIDISRLINRTHTPIARDSLPAVNTCALLVDRKIAERAKRKSKRREQIEALVGGTLLFLPFLIAYIVTCANP
jgi:hypothetical protein